MRSLVVALAHCSCVAILIAFASAPAAAHCDHLDGPVVNEAREALQTGQVAPLLKWIAPADEAELTEAFQHALKVRKESEAAQELADRYFFETFVRIHRASEGEPFTGLKPAGTPVAEGIEIADQAAESGSADELVATITAEVEKGLRKRFDALEKAAAHKDESVNAGREYVAAYVTFIHYVEGLGAAAEAGPAHVPAPDTHAAHAVHATHENEHHP